MGINSEVRLFRQSFFLISQTMEIVTRNFFLAATPCFYSIYIMKIQLVSHASRREKYSILTNSKKGGGNMDRNYLVKEYDTETSCEILASLRKRQNVMKPNWMREKSC